MRRPSLGPTFLGAAIAVAGHAFPLAAQPTPLRLTLADAIARGYETSHRLAELGARRDASAAAVQVARSGDRPQVAALGGYTRTNHVEEFAIFQQGVGFRVIYPDVPDNWRTRLDLQWPVYTGGRVQAITRAATADAQASAEDLDAARTDLRLEVTRAYWGLVTAREAVRVVEEALRRVDAQLGDARARLRSGLVAPSDVTQAEARQALQRTLLIEAKNAAETAAVALRRLAGIDQETPVEPVEPLVAPAAPLGGATALLDEAKRGRRDRAALEARVAAAGARRDAAAAGHKPQLAVTGGADYARPNPKIFPREDAWQTSWDVGVAAAWTLFDGGRVKAEVATTDASRRAAEQRLADFDTALEAEVRQRRGDLDAARAAVGSAAEAIRSAAETTRVFRNRYAAGLATSTEVLDAQVVQLQAELEHTRALAQARLAEAQLERALGHQ